MLALALLSFLSLLSAAHFPPPLPAYIQNPHMAALVPAGAAPAAQNIVPATPDAFESFRAAFFEPMHWEKQPLFLAYLLYKARLAFKPLPFLSNSNPVLNPEAGLHFPQDIYKTLFENMLPAGLVNWSMTCKTFAKMIRTEEFASKVTTLEHTNQIALETELEIQPWMVPPITDAISPWRYHALNPEFPENHQVNATRYMVRLLGRIGALSAFKGFFALHMAPFPEDILPPCMVDTLWSGQTEVSKSAFWIPEDNCDDLFARFKIIELASIASHTVFQNIFTPVLFAQYLIPAWTGKRKLTAKEKTIITTLATETELDPNCHNGSGRFGIGLFAEILHNITYLTVGGFKSTAKEYKRFHKFFAQIGLDSKLLIARLPRGSNSYEPWQYSKKTIHAFARMLEMDLPIKPIDNTNYYRHYVAIPDPTLMNDELPTEVTPWTVFQALTASQFRCIVQNARVVPKHVDLAPKQPLKMRERTETAESTRAPPKKRTRRSTSQLEEPQPTAALPNLPTLTQNDFLMPSSKK